MKLLRVLGLAGFVVFSQFTLAAPPIPPAALGQVQATIDLCVRVDPQSADKYRELGTAVVGGMSAQERSSDYKKSYRATANQLEKIPADKAVEACRAAFPSK